MNSALVFEHGQGTQAAKAERPSAPRQPDRDEPPITNNIPAASALAGGWNSPRRPRSFWLAVAGVHVLGAWALSQSLRAPAVVPKAEPVQVRLIAPPPPPVQIQHVVATEPRMAPTPLTPVIVPPNVQVTAVAVVAEAAPPVAAPVATAPAPVVQAAPASAGLKQLPPGSVRYLAAPQLTMPRMSRRLGESGTVLLHIAVDTRGQLKSASVKKSSGYERLDSQALLDIRSARFAPYLEQGQPVEWEADAGLQYEIAGR